MAEIHSLEGLHDLKAWELALLTKTPPDQVVWNATRPQANFTYPPFPGLGAFDQENLADSFRRLAAPKSPEKVRLANNLKSAVLTWLRELKLPGKRLALQRPCPAEFIACAREAGCDWEFVPRDPEELINTDSLENCAALLLSQPGRADGFYYPDDAFAALITKLREKNPELLILSEESSSLFCLNEIPPGAIDLSDPLNFRLMSVYPCFTPHGPELSWWWGSDLSPAQGPDHVSVEELSLATQALFAFSIRQGAAFGEFTRKILLVERGLRTFGDALRPLLESGLARVPLWPESGFFLLLDVSQVLNKRGISLRALCFKLAHEHGLIVNPGDFFGAPQCLQICYAGTPKWLEGLGQRLGAALQKDI